jgi:hypothetical protein
MSDSKTRPSVILRFRDLVTENGGTILEHRRILATSGAVWWGWWAKQTETVPREWLARMSESIETGGPVAAWLFDSGSVLMYQINVPAIALSPDSIGIRSPDPSLSPDYYQRGSYPAWFLISELSSGEDSFPADVSVVDADSAINSLRDLATANRTIWQVRYA